MNGVIFTTIDQGSGFPVVERIVHECAAPGTYQQSALHRQEGLASLQITLAGMGAVWPDGQARGQGQALPVGSCLVFRFGQPLVYGTPPSATKDWEFIYVNIAGGAALAMIDGLMAVQGHVLRMDVNHAVLRVLLEHASGEGIRHRRISLVGSSRLVCDLILAIAEGVQRTQEPDRELADEAVGYLLSHIDRPIDIAMIARHCGVTREHISRVFRRRLGMPPAAWIRKERLRQAEILLRSGSLSIAQIGMRVGFSTSSHFIQAFRAAYHTTPSRWRG